MKIQTRKYKKGTTYRCEIQINGQRISKSFKKKSDAEHWGATMLLEKSKVGDDKDKAADALQLSHLSMSEAISKYLGQHTGKDTSVSHRLKFWKAQIGHIAVCKVTQKHIRDAIKQLQAEGKSGSTQNRFKSAISSVFEYLREEHTTLANPARGIKSKRESRGLDDHLKPEQLDALLEAAQDSDWDRLYMLILMAVSTGARRSELINLRWQDIDFDQQTAYLGDTKNGDRRILPLIDDVIPELKKYREIGKGWVFPHRMNPKYPFQCFDGHWYKALKQSGVKVRFHGLRHTAGSWLANNGETATAIQQLLGHKSITTTQRYVHHDINSKRSAAVRAFSGIGKKKVAK